MFREVLDDFLDQRKHGLAPAVDEALAADLYNIGVGQDLDHRLRVQVGHRLLVGGAAPNEQASHSLQSDAVHALPLWPPMRSENPAFQCCAGARKVALAMKAFASSDVAAVVMATG